MPSTWRKKPVQIQAEKFDDFGKSTKRESWDKLLKFTGGLVKYIPREEDDDMTEETYYVFDYLHNTWVEFYPNDWIIKGVRGEFYPIKDDVLHETYEEVPTHVVLTSR